MVNLSSRYSDFVYPLRRLTRIYIVLSDFICCTVQWGGGANIDFRLLCLCLTYAILYWLWIFRQSYREADAIKTKHCGCMPNKNISGTSGDQFEPMISTEIGCLHANVDSHTVVAFPQIRCYRYCPKYSMTLVTLKMRSRPQHFKRL